MVFVRGVHKLHNDIRLCNFDVTPFCVATNLIQTLVNTELLLIDY